MRHGLSALVTLAVLAAPAAAQQRDLPPGVELATRYTKLGRPVVAVRPFSGATVLGNVPAQFSDIIRNDLRLSDRFEIMPVPERLATEGPVEYDQWNSLNVVYLVAGEVIAVPGGFQLDLKIHDVVYGTIKQATSVPIPLVSSPNFRLAVHAAADDVVRTVTGQPGMAATRVSFVRQNGRGNYDLLVVDSDGENLRRIAGAGTQIYSPTWSPDGRRLAYTMRETEGWRLIERDMESGTTRTIHSGSGLIMTPAYSPDGTKIAFSLYIPGGAEIHEYDVSRACCLRKLTDSPGDNMYPSYSPDGRQITFMSTRTGKHHVYVMTSDGGTATILSRFGEGVEYNAPDWSPTGSGIAFHGTSRGTFQLMLGDASRPGGQLQQLTSRGWNEDPSWAPDGRHLVFTQGLGRGEAELYVIDIVTGSVRQLVAGNNLRLADWSPSLARLATGGQ